MAEPRRRGGNRVSGRPPRPEEARHRDAAEGDDDPQVREEHRLPLQIRLAPGELRTGRLVRRRGASDSGDNVAISELEAIVPGERGRPVREPADRDLDRKSTRLNSSHANISYAVFCSKENTSELQSRQSRVGRLLLEKKRTRRPFSPASMCSWTT